jgi:membrane-associated PAP2 superfamily phosphatase
METAASAAIIGFISLNLIVYHGEPDCGYFQYWLIGSLAIYTVDLILSMNQLMQVKKNGRENLWLMFFTWVIVLSVNTGWYIWGNILYYN